MKSITKHFMIFSVFSIGFLINAQNESERNFGEFSDLVSRHKDYEKGNPKMMAFILAYKGRLDGHFYGCNAVIRAIATSRYIHNKLEEETKKHGDQYQKAAEGLGDFDKYIIHNCANITAKKRKGEESGTVKGLGALSLFESNCDSENYYRNACPCEFWDKLTDDQVKQVQQGTAPKGFVAWLFKG